MDQPLFVPENQYPESGADSSSGAGGLAAVVAGMVGDPRGRFARALIVAYGLDASQGRVLGSRIEDVVDQVFVSESAALDCADSKSTDVASAGPGSAGPDPAGPAGDPGTVSAGAGPGRLSRSDMVSFVQATSRQVARMEALRAWAMAMLTRDAAYHECDTDWATDDGTGRACPTCSPEAPAAAEEPAGEGSGSDGSASPDDGAAGDVTAGCVDGSVAVGRVDRRVGTRPSVSPIGQVGLEISAALGMSPTFATTLVDAAVDQVAELPATWAAMTTGGIDGYKARVIAAGTRPLIENVDLAPSDPQYAAEMARREQLRRDIETRVLPNAGTKTGEQLRRQVRGLVLRADPG